MPLTFEECDRLFRNDNIGALGADINGARYLKIRSLSRRESLERLFDLSHRPRPDGNAAVLFRAAFESAITAEEIQTCIRDLYEAERAIRRGQEADLINQLYRLQEFNWGGLHQNSLEKTIVDNYVKRIRNFDRLNEAIEHELYSSMRGYVLCSWYNHWTSIMIEDVFKDHAAVLPAVGLVKKIDFFINDTPFDLKVTYLPEGYLARLRQETALRPELTLLKQAARRFDIPTPADLSSSALLQDLWIKVADHPNPECQAVVRQLHEFRDQQVARLREDPVPLIRWLYEEQGVRRFDASNRLFLILVDQRNYFESWKLKRAKPLLEAQVGAYLDAVGERVGHAINFQWEGDNYNAVSDLIVVTNAEAAA
jgi:hypothetical protein